MIVWKSSRVPAPHSPTHLSICVHVRFLCSYELVFALLTGLQITFVLSFLLSKDHPYVTPRQPPLYSSPLVPISNIIITGDILSDVRRRALDVECNIMVRSFNDFYCENVRIYFLCIVVDLRLAVNNINLFGFPWKFKNVLPSHCCWPTFSCHNINLFGFPWKFKNVLRLHCCWPTFSCQQYKPIVFAWKTRMFPLHCCWPTFSCHQYKPIVIAVEMQECVPLHCCRATKCFVPDMETVWLSSLCAN
jgi:hypothetical protein